MTYTVARIAELVGGTLRGDGAKAVRAALPLEEATADSITFITDRKYLPKLEKSSAGAVLAPPGLVTASIPTIEVTSPLAAILTIAGLFTPPLPEPAPTIDPRAAIDPSAQIGDGCHVGPFAVIEAGVTLGNHCIIHAHAIVRAGCSLGNNVEIHPHAVLYPRTVVGDRTVVHSTAVVGCDGFGYQFREGKHQKIPQIGCVHLGADVEIGAGSAVDRATFGTTRIGDGTKIDNQVMIGHNCQIGKHNIFVSQSGIAGSSSTGDYVVLAAKVGIADHLHIGAGAKVGAAAGVHIDIPPGETYLGTPVRPEKQAKRYYLALEKVPEMRTQLAEIRRHLGLDNKVVYERSEESIARKAVG